MAIFKRYLLELTVFIVGAVVMIFELVGSRVLGPYLGTSIFVWTSLIGVILGSLSLGYFMGGRMADKKASLERLSLIILLSALMMAFIAIFKDVIMLAVIKLFKQEEIASFMASLILFAPVSFIFGIVSPYAVRLKLNNLNTSGATVGDLYAISTVGSISGTFLAGFFLISHFGVTRVLFFLAFTLLILSFLLAYSFFFKTKITFLLIIFLLSFTQEKFFPQKIIDLDTQYNRIWIYETKYKGKDILALATDPYGIQSAMALEDDDLVFDYTKYYRLVKHFNPGFKKGLMLGGAAYSYPKDYLRQFPEAVMDVVEIDPKVTELAKKYFRLKDDPRLNIYHEDGRFFLNRTDNKYDVIFGDAFNSFSAIPFQLTTEEAIKREYEILNDKGIVILNLISAIEGEKGEFLRAEYKTYRQFFSQVYLFPVTHPDEPDKVQNIILVALKTKIEPELKSNDPDLKIYLQHLWTGAIDEDLPILTDDFVPVERYKRNML